MDDDFDSQAQKFLSKEKSLWGRIIWRSQNRNDYVEARAQVLIQSRKVDSRLILLSHLFYKPLKFSLSLIFRNQSIMRLDVNPGRPHYNKETLEVVDISHWHYRPNMDFARADVRNIPFSQWVQEFLSKAVINSSIHIPAPPQGEQKLLTLDGKSEHY